MASIKQLTGGSNFDRFILVTVRSQQPQSRWEKNEQDRHAKDLMDKHWSRVIHFDQTPKSAARIMEKLAAKPGQIRLQLTDTIGEF